MVSADKQADRSSFWQILNSQIQHGTANRGGSDGRGSSGDNEGKVLNFVSLPWFFERLMLLGSLICLDVLLFIVAFLPIKVFADLKECLIGRKLPSRQQWCDLMRFVIIVATVYLLQFLHMSRFYHFIRGQNVIKLFTVFNMLQIFDKLFCSLGEDIMASLFDSVLNVSTKHRNESQTKRVLRSVFYFVLSFLYVLFHALVLLGHVITINVALNSSNNSLYVILISNNFVELKTNIFKRFRRINLLQLTCSDIVERIQNIVLLVCIAGQNLSHIGLRNAHEWITDTLYASLAVVGSECVVDWIKHGFITKFNQINLDAYRDYSLLLCDDVLSAYLTGEDAQYGGSVCRRFGFPSTALAVIWLRVFSQAFVSCEASFWLKMGVVVIVLLVLAAAKQCLYVTLLGFSFETLEAYSKQSDTSRFADLGLWTKPLFQREDSDPLKQNPKFTPKFTPMTSYSTVNQRQPHEESGANLMAPNTPRSTPATGALHHRSLLKVPDFSLEGTPIVNEQKKKPKSDSPEDLAHVDRFGLYTSRVP